MFQRRQNVIAFPASNLTSRLSKLNSLSCKVLPAKSSTAPSLQQKTARLQAERPEAAAFLEKLVDDLLISDAQER